VFGMPRLRRWGSVGEDERVYARSLDEKCTFGVGKAFLSFLYGSVVSADLSVEERARLRIMLWMGCSSTSSVLDVLVLVALFLRL
jgi:hypothetical protein